MSRHVYFIGGLAAMLLIVLAHQVTVPTRSEDRAAATATARAAPDDPAAAALEDLAAWPGVPRR